MITLYRDVARPLEIEEVDGNFEDLDNRVKAIEEGSSVAAIDTITQNPDLSLSINLVDGRTAGPFQMPARPVRFRGDRVVGGNYLVGDAYAFEGTTYITLQAHVAALEIGDDLGAANIDVLAAAGKSLLQVTGAWSVDKNYRPGEMVTVGPSPDLWIANKFTVGEAPGASTAWARIAFGGLIPGGSVILMSIGVLLDDFAATTKAAIEDLQARVAALEAA